MGSVKKQIESHYKEPETTLARYAKAIAAVVEAGGPEPTPFMRAAMFDDDMKPKTVGRIYREPLIAVLEKYVREDVVVWFDGKYQTHSDVYRAYQPTNTYFASIERVPSGDRVFYTDTPMPHADALLAFLEAIASVVAGEKVNTRLDSDESSSGEVG
jgi:hypothetical protein